MHKQSRRAPSARRPAHGKATAVGKRRASPFTVALAATALLLLTSLTTMAAGHRQQTNHNQHLQTMTVRMQAHRGVSTEFPENTLVAFRAAVEQGYDIIELDPKCTADGVFVILHDTTTDRTGRPRHDQGEPLPSNDIRKLTLAQARQLEFGSWLAPQFRGEPIPTLADVLDFAGGSAIHLKFDNCWQSFTETQRQSFLDQLAAAELGERMGITVNSLSLLQTAATRLPQAEIHWDGANDDATLRRVVELSRGHRLTIWVCFDNAMTAWFKGAEKASEALCRRVRQYGDIGLWILSREDERQRAIQLFHADAIETTGSLKPLAHN